MRNNEYSALLKASLASLFILFAFLSNAQNNLEPPKGLRVEIEKDGDNNSHNNNDVLISWEFPMQSSGFKGFIVYNNGIRINEDLLTDTSFQHRGLPFDSTYIYQTEAVYDSDTSGLSNRGIVTIRDEYFFDMGSGSISDSTWTIFIDSAMVGDAVVSPGDEFAVFDGDTVVGLAKLKKQPLPGDSPFEIPVVAFKNIYTGSVNTGYIPGNPYNFKLYDASMGQVYDNYNDKLIKYYSDTYVADTFPSNNEYSVLQIKFLPGLTKPLIEEENISVLGNKVRLTWTHDINQRDLIRYNVFRNGEQQNSSPITKLSFTDERVPFGQHSYYVEAIYDEGAISSNSVEINTVNTNFYEPISSELRSPMEINIQEALWMKEPLQQFDEIGIFKYMQSDSVCIAATRLPVSMDNVSSILLLVNSDDPSTTETIEGFQGDDTLHFHFYKYDNETEYEKVMVSKTSETKYDTLVFTPDKETSVDLNWLPSAPVNLSANVEQYDVTLSWNENPDNKNVPLIGYNIYRENTQIANNESSNTSYQDTDLLVGNYCYRVEAEYDQDITAMSDSLPVTIPMQQFMPVSKDSSAGTMTFFITQAQIDGEDLKKYDEIGIFTSSESGEICVGGGSLHDNLTSSSPLEINAYKNTASGDKDGFNEEDSIIYRFWKHDEDKVYHTITPSFPQAPEYKFEEFSSGDTCYVNLSFTTPPEVNYYADVQDLCKGGTDHLYVRVENFREISELHLGLLIDTDHYEVENVEAGPDFMGNMEFSNLNDTLTVDWQSDDSYSLTNRDTLLDITILTRAQGNTSLDWTEESYSVGKELQDYDFQGGDFYIDKKPDAASGIAGDSDVCSGVSFSNYSVSSISGADEYAWELTPNEAGNLITNGANCQVFWNSDFEAEATLSVAGNNHCGTGDSAYKTINISKSVIVDVAIEMVNNVQCQGDTVKIVANPQNQGNNPEYSWYINEQKSYQSSDILTGTNFSDEDEIYCVLESSQGCAENNPAESNTITLTMNPLPERASQIVGNTVMCTTIPSSEYVTPGSRYSKSYQWRMNPAEAGSINCLDGDCQQIRIEWNTEWEGTAFLWVQGVNDCGTGPYNSSPHKITRDYCTNVSDISENGWKFYPNPADEILHIKNESSEEIKWELISVSGQVLKNGQLSEGEGSISLKPYNSGIYFLRIQSADNVSLHKVIKK